MTMKMAFTTDAVTCWPSDSAEPFTARPSMQAINADDDRHEGRLDHADEEGREVDRLAQPHQEHVGAHAAVHPGDEAAAEDRRERGAEGQQRQADDEA